MYRAGKPQTGYSYWDLDAQSPVQAPGYNTRGVFRFNDDDKRSPFNSDMNNWQPRVGLAYALNNKTAIRAGYGLFYQLSRATVFGHTGAGFNINSHVELFAGLECHALRQAEQSLPGWDPAAAGPLAGRQHLHRTGRRHQILGSNSRNPEYHSWNFSIQREVGWQSVFEMNYTGSRGTHLFMPVTTLSPLAPQYWTLGRNTLTSASDESVLRPDH
ncbi:MAG: TonB-dependent receptor [Paludibaculum sp.]